MQNAQRIDTENTLNTQANEEKIISSSEIFRTHLHKINEDFKDKYGVNHYAALTGRLEGYMICMLIDLEVFFPDAYQKVIKQFY